MIKTKRQKSKSLCHNQDKPIPSGEADYTEWWQSREFILPVGVYEDDEVPPVHVSRGRRREYVAYEALEPALSRGYRMFYPASSRHLPEMVIVPDSPAPSCPPVPEPPLNWSS